MIEYDIGKAEETIVFARNLENLLHLGDTSVRSTTILEEAGVILELVANGIRAVALASFLEGWVVQHRISTLLRFGKVATPLGKWAHPLGHDSEDRDAIEREIDVVVEDGCTLASREGFEARRKNGGAGLDAENWVDIEIAFAAFDALPRIAVVFDPEHEGTGVRDGKVNLDGLGEIRWKPAD